MDLIDYLTVRGDALPVAMLPAVSGGIDEDGPAVRPGNLRPGSGVGQRRAAIEAERVAGSGTESGHVGREPAARLGGERDLASIAQDQPDRPRPFRPDPEAGAVAGDFRAVGVPASR